MHASQTWIVGSRGWANNNSPHMMYNQYLGGYYQPLPFPTSDGLATSVPDLSLPMLELPGQPTDKEQGRTGNTQRIEERRKSDG